MVQCVSMHMIHLYSRVSIILTLCLFLSTSISSAALQSTSQYLAKDTLWDDSEVDVILELGEVLTIYRRLAEQANYEASLFRTLVGQSQDSQVVGSRLAVRAIKQQGDGVQFDLADGVFTLSPIKNQQAINVGGFWSLDPSAAQGDGTVVKPPFGQYLKHSEGSDVLALIKGLKGRKYYLKKKTHREHGTKKIVLALLREGYYFRLYSDDTQDLFWFQRVSGRPYVVRTQERRARIAPQAEWNDWVNSASQDYELIETTYGPRIRRLYKGSNLHQRVALLAHWLRGDLGRLPIPPRQIQAIALALAQTADPESAKQHFDTFRKELKAAGIPEPQATTVAAQLARTKDPTAAKQHFDTFRENLKDAGIPEPQATTAAAQLARTKDADAAKEHFDTFRKDLKDAGIPEPQATTAAYQLAVTSNPTVAKQHFDTFRENLRDAGIPEPQATVAACYLATAASSLKAKKHFDDLRNQGASVYEAYSQAVSQQKGILDGMDEPALPESNPTGDGISLMTASAWPRSPDIYTTTRRADQAMENFNDWFAHQMTQSVDDPARHIPSKLVYAARGLPILSFGNNILPVELVEENGFRTRFEGGIWRLSPRLWKLKVGEAYVDEIDVDKLVRSFDIITKGKFSLDLVIVDEASTYHQETSKIPVFSPDLEIHEFLQSAEFRHPLDEDQKGILQAILFAYQV